MLPRRAARPAEALPCACRPRPAWQVSRIYDLKGSQRDRYAADDPGAAGESRSAAQQLQRTAAPPARPGVPSEQPAPSLTGASWIARCPSGPHLKRSARPHLLAGLWLLQARCCWMRTCRSSTCRAPRWWGPVPTPACSARCGQVRRGAPRGAAGGQAGRVSSRAARLTPSCGGARPTLFIASGLRSRATSLLPLLPKLPSFPPLCPAARRHGVPGGAGGHGFLCPQLSPPACLPHRTTMQTRGSWRAWGSWTTHCWWAWTRARGSWWWASSTTAARCGAAPSCAFCGIRVCALSGELVVGVISYCRQVRTQRPCGCQMLRASV